MKDNKLPFYVKMIPVILIALILGVFCIYGQDVGEVCILRNWGGQLAGTTEEAGFHLKAPWQSIIRYDIRNNIVNLYRDSDMNTIMEPQLEQKLQFMTSLELRQM